MTRYLNAGGQKAATRSRKVGGTFTQTPACPWYPGTDGFYASDMRPQAIKNRLSALVYRPTPTFRHCVD